MAYEKKKIVLFDGTNMDNWVTRDGKTPDWKVEDGIMTVGHGDIISKETYGDAHLHVEFRCPYMPEEHGQGRGNSGVYVHGCYEFQVLDSYGVEDYSAHDCASLYSVKTALTNACLPPLEWQTYDMIFRAPRFDADGNKIEDARITLIQNGYVVHNNYIIPSTTPGGVRGNEAAEGPLLLQDHGNPVSYRNIWIMKI